MGESDGESVKRRAQSTTSLEIPLKGSRLVAWPVWFNSPTHRPTHELTDSLTHRVSELDPLDVLDTRRDVLRRIGRLVLQIVVLETVRLRRLEDLRPVHLTLADHRLQRVGDATGERAA